MTEAITPLIINLNKKHKHGIFNKIYLNLVRFIMAKKKKKIRPIGDKILVKRMAGAR